MAKRMSNRERVYSAVSRLSEHELGEVLDYISIMKTMQEQPQGPEEFEDEILAILANAWENQRARTVVEWERIRRQCEHQRNSSLREH